MRPKGRRTYLEFLMADELDERVLCEIEALTSEMRAGFDHMCEGKLPNMLAASPAPTPAKPNGKIPPSGEGIRLI
jgi:hypothetical protein